MEMREVEKEIRGAIDPRLDPPDTPPSLRQAQDSASLRTSPNLPPSAERENTTQSEPPANKADAPAAVPGGESSADDGAGSIRDPDEHV